MNDLDRRFVQDSSETTFLSLCSSCLHKHLDAATCDAFLSGIPERFLDGDDKHTKSMDGDHGIQYEPIVGEVQESESSPSFPVDGEKLAEFNPYHDELGRFASGEGGGGMSASIHRSPDESGSVDFTILEDWSGPRRTVAREALVSHRLHRDTDLIVGRDGKEVIGIAAVRKVNEKIRGLDGEYMTLSDLATKRSGYGRQMMEQVKSEAKRRGSGIILNSATDAHGFYVKLGMHNLSEVSTRLFYWMPSEIAAMIESKSDTDEPKDGVFAVPFDFANGEHQQSIPQ